MKIPKIIHQTWKDNNIPGGFQRLAATWRQHHPGWEYKLWTDSDSNRFIDEFFPAFRDRYYGYASPIQRVDAARYLILHRYGGMFVDLDFECYRSLEPLLGDAGCCFGEEPTEHCILHGKDNIISNAIMAAAPGHPFLWEVYEELSRQTVTVDDKNSEVLESTGPFMLTRLYEASANKQSVRILSHEQVYPLTKNDIDQWLRLGIKSPEVERKVNDAYAIHYYSGTWWDTECNIGMLETSK